MTSFWLVHQHPPNVHKTCSRSAPLWVSHWHWASLKVLPILSHFSGLSLTCKRGSSAFHLPSFHPCQTSCTSIYIKVKTDQWALGHTISLAEECHTWCGSYYETTSLTMLSAPDNLSSPTAVANPSHFRLPAMTSMDSSSTSGLPHRITTPIAYGLGQLILLLPQEFPPTPSNN